MELRAVRCFVAVADEGTLTAGAALLGVGQPAVTRQIQQLERQLRIRLFDREDGRLRLTSVGADFLPAARRLLLQADDVADAARGVAAGRLQRVRLASTGTTRDDVLAPWLATRSPQDPMPSISEARLDDLYATLRRSADLVVAPLTPPADLASRVIGNLGLWACVPLTHPWIGRFVVGIEEVAQADLLLLHARRTLGWLWMRRSRPQASGSNRARSSPHRSSLRPSRPVGAGSACSPTTRASTSCLSASSASTSAP